MERAAGLDLLDMAVGSRPDQDRHPPQCTRCLPPRSIAQATQKSTSHSCCAISSPFLLRILQCNSCIRQPFPAFGVHVHVKNSILLFLCHIKIPLQWVGRIVWTVTAQDGVGILGGKSTCWCLRGWNVPMLEPVTTSFLQRVRG